MFLLLTPFSALKYHIRLFLNLSTPYSLVFVHWHIDVAANTNPDIFSIHILEYLGFLNGIKSENKNSLSPKSFPNLINVKPYPGDLHVPKREISLL